MEVHFPQTVCPSTQVQNFSVVNHDNEPSSTLSIAYCRSTDELLNVNNTPESELINSCQHKTSRRLNEYCENGVCTLSIIPIAFLQLKHFRVVLLLLSETIFFAILRRTLLAVLLIHI